MLKTAESVSPMHPDKVCDRISDCLVDHCLEIDPDAKCGFEVCGGHGKVFVTGEFRSEKINKEYLTDVAMSQISTLVGLDSGTIMYPSIAHQSEFIAAGVDKGGAGDQGIMIGYASDANPSMIPDELFWARSLCQHLFEIWPYDGKTQVTTRDGKIETVVASFQNAPKEDLQIAVMAWLDPETSDVIMPDDVVDEVKLHCNPAGDWTVGGFDADAGLTGRKIAVDSYGSGIPVGGGAFSGKDGTKVDRSGAYMARKLAVTLLKKLKLSECEVHLAYAIGVEQPVMAFFQGMSSRVGYVSGNVQDHIICDLSPAGIMKELNLKVPQFEEIAKWGSFGHNYLWDQPFTKEFYAKNNKKEGQSGSDVPVQAPEKKAEKGGEVDEGAGDDSQHPQQQGDAEGGA